jgi:hypothetical protein
MKVRALLIVIFVAGLAASIALAKPPKGPKPHHAVITASTTTTTTTNPKPKCEHVELKGDSTAASFAFTVTKANKHGQSLVGTTVTLSVPAGAKVKAQACTTPGSAALTLRNLHVKVAPAKP